MRIYKSDRKVFITFDETIEVCRHDQLDTLQRYKDALMEKISQLFDRTVTEAAFKGMETPTENTQKHDESTATSLEEAETVSKQDEGEADRTKELFRAPKDGLKTEGKKTRKKIDYGKIMALHNAGWPNQKIADEMGMTYGAVATAISTYKKKVGGGKA